MEDLPSAFSVLKLDVEDDDPTRGESGASNLEGPFSALELDAQVDDPTRRESVASNLENRFSVLELNAEDDDKGEEFVASNHKDETRKASGNTKKKSNSSESPDEYKFPLVWIDLEMTGLNVDVDRILEIACIITDGKLTRSIEGPDLIIHQSKECLDKMGEWCQSHHEASGLTKKVLESTVSEREAEKQVIEFVETNTGTHKPQLAGNSVYVDFVFMKKYMPDLASLFSHVVVDVSSVKSLCMRWYPRDTKKVPSKENKHRAMDDIRESIQELKYYKQKMFKACKK